ncbi:hypothetical protein [Chryseobacterium sp. X308]|nr:hypothetical protein [Chryseobacterium sp. X308]
MHTYTINIHLVIPQESTLLVYPHYHQNASMPGFLRNDKRCG